MVAVWTRLWFRSCQTTSILAAPIQAHHHSHTPFVSGELIDEGRYKRPWAPKGRLLAGLFSGCVPEARAPVAPWRRNGSAKRMRPVPAQRVLAFMGLRPRAEEGNLSDRQVLACASRSAQPSTLSSQVMCPCKETFLMINRHSHNRQILFAGLPTKSEITSDNPKLQLLQMRCR